MVKKNQGIIIITMTENEGMKLNKKVSLEARMVAQQQGVCLERG